MSSKPNLSIIIPCLNEENILPHLLDDLTQQTFTNFEVIIVDAGSTDQTPQQVKPYTKKLPLTLLTSPVKNVSAQRNQGAQKATSDWLVFIDADTRIPPHFLHQLHHHLTQLDPDFFTTYLKPDTRSFSDRFIASGLNFLIQVQKHTAQPSVIEAMMVVKKDVFDKLDGFDENTPWKEGGELLERAHKQGYKLQVAKTPVFTFSMRRSRTQGPLRLILNTTRLELARLLKINISKKTIKSLYPMKGGGFHK